MTTNIVIPARLGSTRFTQKILADVNGKPLLWHTYQTALKAACDAVIIAVDDQQVADIATGFGAQVVMTSLNHESGTSRLSEVADACAFDDSDIIINLQADEPLMPTENLHQVAQALVDHADCAVATLCEEIKNPEHVFDEHVVKVVRDHQQRALYFSRAPIPWVRGQYPTDLLISDVKSHRHIGLYAYRASFLKAYDLMPESSLEDCESLEQLRFLQAGHKIVVSDAIKSTPVGVDTPDDLIALLGML